MVTGEIAIKTDDAKLFIENDSGHVFEVGETLGTFNSSTITIQLQLHLRHLHIDITVLDQVRL